MNSIHTTLEDSSNEFLAQLHDLLFFLFNVHCIPPCSDGGFLSLLKTFSHFKMFFTSNFQSSLNSLKDESGTISR